MAKEALELMSQSTVKNAMFPWFHFTIFLTRPLYLMLWSLQNSMTPLATCLLFTLAHHGLRQPNYDYMICVDEAVCSYLALVLPAFDQRKVLSLLMDVGAEERLDAKQVEVAKAIREKMGVHVSVDTEVGAAVV